MLSNSPKVPWSGRGSQYTEEEIALVVEAMRSADPQTQGRYQDQFEADFRNITQSPHAFAVTSCTAALELAAILCKIGKGDEVIIPAHTFAASAIPFARTGAHIKWADIDPATFVVSAESIESLITPATKVIVVVHLYGLPVDMDPILALAAQHGIYVVEDVAQALGATYKGKPVGSLGDFGCFSFHTHKNITTLGEGGMLTVRDPDLAATVPGFRHNGMRPITEPREHYWLPAMSTVDFDWEGVWPYNFCLGEVQCAAGIGQLRRLDELNRTRQDRAKRFCDALDGFPELVFQYTPPERTNVRYCLPARYDGPVGTSRDDFIARMAYHHHVRMVVQYYPLYRLPIFQRAGFGEAHCPHTDHFFDAMVSFPFHPWMPEDQFEYMIEATKETIAWLRNR